MAFKDSIKAAFQNRIGHETFIDEAANTMAKSVAGVRGVGILAALSAYGAANTQDPVFQAAGLTAASVLGGAAAGIGLSSILKGKFGPNPLRNAAFAAGGATLGAAISFPFAVANNSNLSPAGVLGVTLGVPIGGALVGAAALRIAGGAIGRTPGGLVGLGAQTLAAGAGIAGGVLNLAKGGELIARGILTGSPVNALRGRGFTQSPMDAWFPFRSLPRGDVRRFAVNPSVVKRGVALAAVGGIISGINSFVNHTAPPPTAFFDGRYTRNVNDMGVDGNYAQSLLGGNSVMNSSNYSALVRTAALAF